ncbi:MAG TPA: class I SAM-dependent methyltransferase [Bacillota bacterium]|nr:class I SAM-dependent methyltransferase [Bacillota bacterium]HPF42795.1 class I SAM-dependent methyltransferase [Bacillota bacterium]HPJ85503.1 class I SAM-dependent methyltransferase [Bacillota bacterium]HPQ62360.1 class I SAM-dependent methyltransferase [Bacillota bacterium]HRX91841.1 class I SAM-dependent methyltransferase [Candidatus Izemoplasmatales bacterium]
MDFDLLANFYDSFIDPQVYDEYLRLLDKYTSLGTLLDIGCGTGTLSLELAKRGYKVMATDLSEELLDIVDYRAKEENINLEIGVYDMLDPISLKFDSVIASMDVINHLTDLEDVEFGFTNIFKALNNNGVFLFDVLSSEYIDMLDGFKDDDKDMDFHWRSDKGEKEHSIVHTITMTTGDGEKHEIKIYEETHDFLLYEEISKKVGFQILETIRMPERTIFVLQKTE